MSDSALTEQEIEKLLSASDNIVCRNNRKSDVSMSNAKSAVITAYGHDKVIEKILVSLFDKIELDYSPDAITYCNTINGPESEEEEWVFAKIVSENSQYAVKEFLPLKFDILLKMDNVAIQRVLMKVNSQDLAMALKGTDETIGEIKEKIFSNMSKTAVQILKEDFRYMPPLWNKDVMEAQEKILKIIIDLEEKHKIDPVIRKFFGEAQVGCKNFSLMCQAGREYCGKLETAEQCLEAVKQNGYALEYVPDEFKTAEMYLEAVKQDSRYTLQYVPDELKTAELCLIAVKEDGMALESVPSKLKTAELCLEAVKRNDAALQFVPKKIAVQIKALLNDKGGTTE
jgi:hypothetical protein